MSFVGRMKDGVVVFESPVAIPDGAAVRVEVAAPVEPEEGPDVEGPSLYEALKDVIGKVTSLPPDFSVNHDHYLYGRPKQQP